MIAHDQTFFGTDKDGSTPGNCTQAALASLLDLPLEQVPHIALFEDQWGQAMVAYLTSIGKRLRVYNDYRTHQEWWEARGVNAYPMDIAPMNQLMLASGQSHSGPWSHVVLWKAGHLVHDPNPLRLGIDGPPYELWQITDLAGQEPTS